MIVRRLGITFLPRPISCRFNDRLAKDRRNPGPSSRGNRNAAAGDQRRMSSVTSYTHQMQTPPDETAGGCQWVWNCQSACELPRSVDGLEYLARLGVVTCELVKPHVGFGQLVDLMPERKM